MPCTHGAPALLLLHEVALCCRWGTPALPSLARQRPQQRRSAQLSQRPPAAARPQQRGAPCCLSSLQLAPAGCLARRQDPTGCQPACTGAAAATGGCGRSRRCRQLLCGTRLKQQVGCGACQRLQSGTQSWAICEVPQGIRLSVRSYRVVAYQSLQRLQQPQHLALTAEGSVFITTAEVGRSKSKCAVGCGACRHLGGATGWWAINLCKHQRSPSTQGFAMQRTL